MAKARKKSAYPQVEMVPIDSLVPWDGNPRMNDAAVGPVMRSMEAFGWTNPILARRKDRMVIAGHTRIKAARERGEQIVPVIFLSLTSAEARLYSIADNQIASLSTWENEKRNTALRDLLALHMDLTLTGFDKGSLRVMTGEGLTDPDEVPEAPEEPVAKRGDVWVCGDHRVMCGDSTDEADVSRLMAGEAAHLCLTDPPYGINIVRGGRVRQPGGRPSGILGGSSGPYGYGRGKLTDVRGKVGGPGVVEPRLYAPVHGDDKPFDPTPILGLAEHHIIFGGTYFSHKLPEGTAWICWDKGISDEATFSAFEIAWTSYEGRHRMYRHRWSGMVRAGPRAEELKDRVHPTQKPVGLFASILDDFTDTGASIIDPFLGSGTTMIAAERLGRHCYGMEIEPRYVDVAVKRWEDFTGQKVKLAT